jgi:hypothetical protein
VLITVTRPEAIAKPEVDLATLRLPITIAVSKKSKFSNNLAGLELERHTKICPGLIRAFEQAVGLVKAGVFQVRRRWFSMKIPDQLVDPVRRKAPFSMPYRLRHATRPPSVINPYTLRSALGLPDLPLQSVLGKVQRPAWQPNKHLPWILNCVRSAQGSRLGKPSR